VWEGPNWRAFAKNRYGISFEVKEGISSSKALDAWDDFKTKIGLEGAWVAFKATLDFDGEKLLIGGQHGT